MMETTQIKQNRLCRDRPTCERRNIFFPLKNIFPSHKHFTGGLGDINKKKKNEMLMGFRDQGQEKFWTHPKIRQDKIYRGKGIIDPWTKDTSD